MVNVRLVTREGSPWHTSWCEIFPEDGSGELKIYQGIIAKGITAVIIDVLQRPIGHWSAALAVASDYLDEWQMPENWDWFRYTDNERYR